jgi:hypothetical protein
MLPMETRGNLSKQISKIATRNHPTNGQVTSIYAGPFSNGEIHQSEEMEDTDSFINSKVSEFCI